MGKIKWQASNVEGAKHLGPLEIELNDGLQPEYFEVLSLEDRLVFGDSTNNTFLESGYILREDGESETETLQELLADLEVYYRDGGKFTSRIIYNERM